MITTVLLATAILLLLAYRFYGRFLERRFGIDDTRPTPAEIENDGVDYVPTRASVLFGHHFSSIAGAGPIVGPIVAASAFGWGPAWLWVLVGAIFVGGVHDLGSTVVSLRHKGHSIIEAFRSLVGGHAAKVMFAFVFLAMIYVIIVFLDLTASGFVATPAVATASGWFVLVAFAFGAAVRFTRLPHWLLVTVFILLTYMGLAIGYWFPAPTVGKQVWIVAVLVYCFIAAILPVNVLLQPRDFLSATFLYAIMVLGMIGAVCRAMGVRHVEGERAQGWRHALGLARTASKADAQERVRAVLGIAKVIRPSHASDAAAVAIVAALRGKERV